MTAVEFLKSQAEKLKYLSPEIFELAKEMEKQQIIDANSNGWHDGQEVIMNKIKTIDFVTKGGDDNGEQYYNKTYGSKKIRYTEEEWVALNNGNDSTISTSEKEILIEATNRYTIEDEIEAFIHCAELYLEQLKSK